jgi:hypothetical protein
MTYKRSILHPNPKGRAYGKIVRVRVGNQKNGKRFINKHNRDKGIRTGMIRSTIKPANLAGHIT